jgi:hypothetical protein
MGVVYLEKVLCLKNARISGAIALICLSDEALA